MASKPPQEIITTTVSENENESLTFLLNDGAKERLLEVGDQQVIVVSIAGRYRTGKSYLLSKLMEGDGNHNRWYFPLGDTVQSKTKGIWMWCGKHPTQPEKILVLLDTEGLDDVEKSDDKHDNIIFVLAVILSDVFVFNSPSAVANSSLHSLHFILELSDHLIKKSDQGQNQTNQREISPDFVWALRDFTLKCEVDGKAVNDDEYLEWILEDKAVAQATSKSANVESANNVRHGLKEFFQRRKCFVFPYPTLDSEKLCNLETVPNDELDAKFVEKTADFCNHVLSFQSKRTILGKSLTASMFVSFVENVLATINQGDVIPSIDNAFEFIAKRENDLAKVEGLKVYDDEWENLRGSFPLHAKYLDDTNKEAKDKSMKKFLSKLVVKPGDKDNHIQEFSRTLLERFEFWKEEIKKESIRVTKLRINQLYHPIELKNEAGKFSKPGGYREYANQLASMEDYIMRDFTLGLERINVLEEFLRGLEGEKAQIQEADKQLSECLLMSELDRARREEAIRREAAARREQKQAVVKRKQLKKDLEESLAILSRDLEEESERNVETFREMQETAAAIQRAEAESEAKNGVKILSDRIEEMRNGIKEKERTFHEEQARQRQLLDERLRQQREQHQREMDSRRRRPWRR